MTNFEWYKMRFNEDTFVERMVMDCRQCPIKAKCPCLTRKDCEKRLRDWCREDTDE